MEKFEQEFDACMEAFADVVATAETAVEKLRVGSGMFRTENIETLKWCQNSVTQIIHRAADIAVDSDRAIGKRNYIESLKEYQHVLAATVASFGDK